MSPPLPLLLLLLSLTPAPTRAISLPTHFASSMVWQRDAPVALWGLDSPGAKISVAFFGAQLPAVTADASGRFSVPVPATPASAAPGSVVVTSSSGAPAVSLEDVVVGDVFVCSGQSNMGIPVSWTSYYAAALAQAGALGVRLRLLQVATLDNYTEAMSPQANFSADIPWSRASATSAAGFSATCYFFGAQAAANLPADVPVGLVANAWGGVAIQVWMSPAALSACPVEAGAAVGAVAGVAPHRAIAIAAAADRAAHAASHPYSTAATPSKPSCLYNSMLAPLLSVPIAGLLWYQGEANAADAVGYECLQREMIADWRRSWALTRAPDAPVAPFVFVQLACWPTGDPTGRMLAVFRAAQQRLADSMPRTGMVVTADQCDPAGAYHPVHPPWKAEVGRRAWLWFDNELYGNASSPRAGPAVVNVTWDAWSSSWGDYHDGTGLGSYVCESVGEFQCGGVRVTFDRPVALRAFYSAAQSEPPPEVLRVYGFGTGAASGFALAGAAADPAQAFSQPAVLTGVSADGLIVQLNVTWVGTPSTPLGGTLYYAWAEFPAAMPLVERASGLPVAPFNVSLSFPPRPPTGNCTFVADTDGSDGGAVADGRSPEECCERCWADPQCLQVAYSESANTTCWLKYGKDMIQKVGTTLCVLDDL